MLYIILGSIMILIVFLFTLSKESFELFESFKSDYSDYNSIDRIQVDDKYAYCIGATPTCETGVPVKGSIYSNGNTYKSYCDDGSNMICNNFVSTNFDSGNNYVWKTPNNVDIIFSKIYKGFTEPTDYIPAVINNNLIDFYNDSNSIIDSINKCSILGLNEKKCLDALNIPFKFADKYNDITGYSIIADKFNEDNSYNSDPESVGYFSTSYTEPVPESTGFSGMYPGLPCIADYGSMPGDNVCNGEVGLIQDQSLVCPYYKPICNGYRCDSNFGKCDYDKSK